jgi:hypothetical protein
MNELLTLSAAQLALLITTIVGVNELLVRLRAKDYWTAITIASAAILGGLFSLYYHVDFVGGVAAGFSAAGTLKGLSMLGNKSSASPSTDSLVVK